MCIRRKNSHEANKVMHLRNGLIIVKSQNNGDANIRVNLTRKTVRDGSTRYGVTITKIGTHRHTRLNTFDNISDAWDLYKRLRSA